MFTNYGKHYLLFWSTSHLCPVAYQLCSTCMLYCPEVWANLPSGLSGVPTRSCSCSVMMWHSLMNEDDRLEELNQITWGGGEWDRKEFGGRGHRIVLPWFGVVWLRFSFQWFCQIGKTNWNQPFEPRLNHSSTSRNGYHLNAMTMTNHWHQYILLIFCVPKIYFGCAYKHQ